MRTTLDLDDALVRKAKGRATDEGTTLSALIGLGEFLRVVTHPRERK